MLGWLVLVYPKSNEDAKLASWEVGVSGLRWLDALVAEGKAEKLNGNGYPTRYQARADFVLPLLENGSVAPPTNKPQNWIGALKLNAENIAACSPDHVLVIDAWDQS